MGFPWPGDHPATGAPFIAFTLDTKTERQELRYNPPQYPEREYVSEWGYDGPIAWHTRTDEELAEAVTAYEASLAEWKRTGGRAFAVGATTTKARFTTTNGDWAVAVLAGPRWHWVEWSAD